MLYNSHSDIITTKYQANPVSNAAAIFNLFHDTKSISFCFLIPHIHIKTMEISIMESIKCRKIQDTWDIANNTMAVPSLYLLCICRKEYKKGIAMDKLPSACYFYCANFFIFSCVLVYEYVEYVMSTKGKLVRDFCYFGQFLKNYWICLKFKNFFKIEEFIRN